MNYDKLWKQFDLESNDKEKREKEMFSFKKFDFERK